MGTQDHGGSGYPEDAYHAFASYAHRDENQVLGVIEALEQNGELRIWSRFPSASRSASTYACLPLRALQMNAALECYDNGSCS